MKSHQVLKEAFDNSSPKLVASELGVSLSLVYKWAQEQSELGSGSRNPLDRVVEIYNHTSHEGIIEWLCEQCDGYYVPNPDHQKPNDLAVLPAANEIIAQFSHMLTQIAHAAKDHSIDPDEAQDIRQCWDQLKGVAEGFVRCCEQGDFEKMGTLVKDQAQL
ncbi:hypothetical protein [Persicirhabdus sediminis]|uniref:Uncharacterized protein n=1 Tax=Persicirhabdus sediminis TaxID=454144 RepID=A0A8J7MCU9_9BACT|nr:hypothetical protein [Persicirhabdus sediminis]MBK1791379.1 hypothetical protein [Persicirhabdus sediminis]